MYLRKMLKLLILLFYFFALIAVMANSFFYTSFFIAVKNGEEEPAEDATHRMDIGALFMTTSYWMLTAALMLTMY